VEDDRAASVRCEASSVRHDEHVVFDAHAQISSMNGRGVALAQGDRVCSGLKVDLQIK
jgi:hypothetical protein